MKTNRFRSVVVLAMVVVLALIPVSGICGQTPELFKAPENSTAEYTGYTRAAEYVTMSDGTKLATVRYVPSGGPDIGAFPVVLIYHPYHYDTINPVTGEIKPTYLAMDFYTSHGYVVVSAEMRGSGGSYGTRMNLSPQLADDGKEVVDWIAKQSWCDGNVGMIGTSYMGWSQYATAGRQPKALKCIIPGFMGFDEFTRATQYPGGIQHKAGIFFGGGPTFFDLNEYWPAVAASTTFAFPVPPMIDENGDGNLLNEIPLYVKDANGNYRFPSYPLTYSDGMQRQDIYYHMTQEHLKNPLMVSYTMAFRDDPAYIGSDITFGELGLSDFPVRIAETRIPILHEAGWFDKFLTGQTYWYATLAKTNPSGLIIAPSMHNWSGMVMGSDPGPYIEYFGENKAEFIQGFQYMRLRFLDYYLKGIRNGADKQSMVYIYVMNGEGWRTEKEWPLKRQKMTDFMFDEGNSLTDKKPDKSQNADNYVADFTHDSRQPATKASRWNGVLNAPLTRTEPDKKALTYTGSPLDEDTEVTGHPIVHLWVSSTADDGDFFVYLEDVDENGNALFVTDGMLRAGFAKLVPNEDMLPKGSHLKVLPDLPWHGFKKSDYVRNIFASGNDVELTFDLFPTSWVFKKGHKIRVSIACADYPTFTLHPMLAPNNKPVDPNNIVPTITVHRDKKHPSRVELPVIPRHGKDKTT